MHIRFGPVYDSSTGATAWRGKTGTRQTDSIVPARRVNSTGGVWGGHSGAEADFPPRLGTVRPPFAGAVAGGEGLAEGLGVRIGVLGPLGQAAEHDPLEVGRHVGPPRA